MEMHQLTPSAPRMSTVTYSEKKPKPFVVVGSYLRP
jgi:hypothetical protein